jgi:hypothetical protein
MGPLYFFRKLGDPAEDFLGAISADRTPAETRSVDHELLFNAAELRTKGCGFAERTNRMHETFEAGTEGRLERQFSEGLSFGWQGKQDLAFHDSELDFSKFKSPKRCYAYVLVALDVIAALLTAGCKRLRTENSSFTLRCWDH